MGALPRRSARRKEERPTVRYPQGGAKRSSEGYMPSSHARYHDQRTWRRLRARVPSVRGERPKARNHCRGEAGVRRCPRSVGFSAESPNTGSPVSENSLCETVRKVSDATETKPYGPPKRGFLAHFGLRVPAKSTPGASLAPFSDSFCRKPVCENLEYRKLSFRELPFSAIQRIR